VPAINRHYIIALVIAPLLAVLAWAVVGNLAKEKPAPAQVGQSYPLLEKSNCRYPSGVCDLENVDFEASMTYRENAQGGHLQLEASHSLSAALVSVGPAGTESPPQAMVPGSATQWTLPLSSRPDSTSRIRLVLKAAGSTYFVEASTAFLQEH
jgi:hypothetical protein